MRGDLYRDGLSLTLRLLSRFLADAASCQRVWHRLVCEGVLQAGADAAAFRLVVKLT